MTQNLTTIELSAAQSRERGIGPHSLTQCAARRTKLCLSACGIILAAIAISRAADDGKTQSAGPGSKAEAAPPHNAATFALRIVGPDGKPVAGVQIELRGELPLTAQQLRRGTFLGRSPHGVLLKADAGGRLALERSPEVKKLEIVIETPGYAPFVTRWDLDGNSEPIPAELTARLDPAWTIGGVIVDEGGKPIPDARVRLTIEYSKRDYDRGDSDFETTVKSDVDGKWLYRSAPDWMSEVHAGISKLGFMTAQVTLTRSDFGLDRGRTPSSKIELEAAPVVTGKVTDETGKPLAGALVRSRFADEFCDAVTSADGTYRLLSRSRGRTDIVASAGGYAPDLRDVRIVPGMAPVDFQMQRGQSVRVRVLNERGNPIPHARIDCYGWRRQLPSQYTDSQGVCEWMETPLAEFLVDILPPQGMEVRLRPLMARKEEYVFRVPPALVVSGNVIDAATKQPLKKFRVTPLTGAGNPPPDAHAEDSFVAVDGKYRIRETEEQSGYALRIEVDGYFPALSRGIKNDEGNASIDFALKKAPDVNGTVLTASGVPAANAKVGLCNVGDTIHLIKGEIRASSSACECTTDAAGHFHFRPLIVDYCLVVAQPAGYAQVTCHPNADPKVLRLAPWARVEGTYQVARKPQPNIEIAIRHDASNFFDNTVPRVNMIYRQSTDANGHFVIDHIPPGEGQVGRRLPGGSNWTFPSSVSCTTVRAKFLSGQTTQVDFGTSGRPVIGQLRRPPAATKTVSWDHALVEADAIGKADRSALHFAATVDAKGNFCMDDVPPGEYVLSAGVNGYSDGKLANHRFAVPAINEKLSQRPVDLGVLTLETGGNGP